MDICFRTFAILFLLFAAASCAPGPRLQAAWAAVRSSSLELHQIAKRVSVEARNGSRDIYNQAQTELAWIEAEDQCDPESLKSQPETCLAKILSVSMSYSSVLENLSTFESCAEFARPLMQPMKNLQTNLGTCVKLSVEPVVSSDEKQRWMKWPLCLYTLERLFSFSILTARVFAVGDPAHHSAGLPQKCT